MADNVVFPVYLGSDFLTSGGVPVTNASDSTVGETYTFQAGATPGRLVVTDDDDDGFFEDSFSGGSTTPNNEAGGLQTLGPGSDPGFGSEGDILELESILTFSGSDGSTLRLLIVNNQSIGGALFSGEFFIPLDPISTSVTYTLDIADQDPDPFPYASIPCFVAGTSIRMADGSSKPVEDIEAGDLVATLDSGAQVVRWAGSRTLSPSDLWLTPALRPIRIRAGHFGTDRDLLVSPQHRMLIRDWRAELLFGGPEVLVCAKDLIDDHAVLRETTLGAVTYVHLLFDRHQIVFAEGAPTESFHPGVVAMDCVEAAVRDEILDLFPAMRGDLRTGYGKSARMSVKPFEARVLRSRAS